ncbi:MAG: chemotaxis protein CheW [Dehalococcoidia bacterium]
MSNSSAAVTHDTAHAQQGVEQHLTFIVADEEYGVDILRVQGIQGWAAATAIPNTPPHVLGVINLRGTVVPVVDLRQRFSLPPVECGSTTVVIIVRVEDNDKERIVGMVVDAVSEVYNVANRDIQATPEFGVAADSVFVRGLAVMEKKMVILLDIDRLLSVVDTYVHEDDATAGGTDGPCSLSSTEIEA